MVKQPNNILNQAELVTISILQQIKIELLEKKAEKQRDGRALEEPEIDDDPQQEDFLQEQIEGAVTWAQIIEGEIDLPTPIEELAKSAAKLEPASDSKVIQARKPGLRARFNAWLIARNAWKVRKATLEREYERTKQDVKTYCNAIDAAIKIIDREIERQRNGTAIKVEPPKHLVTIS